MKRKTYKEVVGDMSEMNPEHTEYFGDIFHANDDYMDAQDNRIAELEERFKNYKDNSSRIRNYYVTKTIELKRQNALLEKCRAFYADESNWTSTKNSYFRDISTIHSKDIGGVDGHSKGGKLAIETKRMVDED